MRERRREAQYNPKYLFIYYVSWVVDFQFKLNKENNKNLATEMEFPSLSPATKIKVCSWSSYGNKNL